MCTHEELCFSSEMQVLDVINLKFLVASEKVAHVKGTVLVSLPPNGQDIVVGCLVWVSPGKLILSPVLTLLPCKTP